jgi:hypothetical protein
LRVLRKNYLPIRVAGGKSDRDGERGYLLLLVNRHPAQQVRNFSHDGSKANLTTVNIVRSSHDTLPDIGVYLRENSEGDDAGAT